MIYIHYLIDPYNNKREGMQGEKKKQNNNTRRLYKEYRIACKYRRNSAPTAAVQFSNCISTNSIVPIICIVKLIDLPHVVEVPDITSSQLILQSLLLSSLVPVVCLVY